MEYGVSLRSLIAKLCILGMLMTFVIVVRVVRADYGMICDYCNQEWQCNAAHFAVEQWYFDSQQCNPDCESEKENRDSACESTKNSQEQSATNDCTNQQTQELDENCLSLRMTDIQTQYFGCLDYAEWRYNGCLQDCDNRFQDPPEDCFCSYQSCANGCCL